MHSGNNKVKKSKAWKLKVQTLGNTERQLRNYDFDINQNNWHTSAHAFHILFFASAYCQKQMEINIDDA